MGATTRAKPATATEEVTSTEPTSAAESSESADAALTEKITAVVKSLLADLPGTGESTSTEEPGESEGKSLTSREEESRTYRIVADAIKTFKEEVVGTEEKATKVAETVPGKSTTRWIEKHVWGIE